jgi:tRNA pseudouridine55 synthase
LSYSLDEACLQSFPRRDLTAEEAEDTRHGRPLKPVGVEGMYAATAPDGQVIALLKDEPKRTKSVVVLRPATL